MTLDDLTKRNEKFQQKATELVELLPGSNLLSFSSAIIRSSKKIDKTLHQVLAAKSQTSFYTKVDALEEDMDELIFMLDRLDDANRSRKILAINDFVKRGYELLSLYSMCSDQIMERRMSKQDEFE